MDEVITRAISLINQILKSCSNVIKPQLIDTRNNLNRLLNPDLSRTNWTRLFCRQLKRSLDCNNARTNDFWIEMHNDILYVLDESNDEQHEGSSWKSFLEKMNLERKLEQREIQFQQTFGERKSLNQLLFEHQNFFGNYLQKCVCLHYKLQVPGLTQNIDDLLYRTYGLKNVSLTSESRKDLEEKLKCIEIVLDCSGRSVPEMGSVRFMSRTEPNRTEPIGSVYNFSNRCRFRFGSVLEFSVSVRLKF